MFLLKERLFQKIWKKLFFTEQAILLNELFLIVQLEKNEKDGKLTTILRMK